MTDLQSENYIKAQGLLFSIRRSVRYHTARRKFFDSINNTVTAVSLISGTASVAAILSSHQTTTILLGVLVTVLNALNLVIKSSEKARNHADFVRKFIELEKKLLKKPFAEFTFDELSAIEQERLDIERDEPPIKRVLDIICHNELAIAMGAPPEEIYEVGWWQKTFKNFIDIGAQKISRKAIAA